MKGGCVAVLAAQISSLRSSCIAPGWIHVGVGSLSVVRRPLSPGPLMQPCASLFSIRTSSDVGFSGDVDDWVYYLTLWPQMAHSSQRP